MAIITKAGSPVKGSPTLFTLSKSALAAVTSVAADSYYSQSSNWKEVSLVYKSSTGNQSETLKFDASLSSPTANFAVSLKALDVFQIKKIVIKDFDGGIFEVPRSQLTTAEFDVDMSGGSSPSNYIDWTDVSPQLTETANGGLINNGTYNWGYNASSTTSSSLNSADWTYIFNVTRGANCEFSLGTNRAIAASLGFNEIDYGFHINQSGFVDISLQHNYNAYPSVTSVGVGTYEFKIVYTHADYTVKFYVNSALVHTQSGGSGYFTVFPTSYPVFAFYNTTADGLSLLSSSKT